jgi:cation diffusion facilitator family transporter
VKPESDLTPEQVDESRFAMKLSLAVGVLMLAGKTAAYWITGSAAILSDAAESVIHVVAVAFAAFALWLSLKPANQRFPFGYERIAFFSAGFEGALIILAAITIIVAAIQKWLAGVPLDSIGVGTLIIVAASILNGGLGAYLIRTGRRNHSLILEANGKHVLTDCWTSVGVVGGLSLVMLTGWRHFDPICAIVVALNILYSGGKLVWRSVGGLLDYTDPRVGDKLHRELTTVCGELGVRFHGVRYRSTGQRLIVHVHLLFPFATSVGEAHRQATEIEQRVSSSLDSPAEIVTHLESAEDHSEVHERGHHATEAK